MCLGNVAGSLEHLTFPVLYTLQLPATNNCFWRTISTTTSCSNLPTGSSALSNKTIHDTAIPNSCGDDPPSKLEKLTDWINYGYGAPISLRFNSLSQTRHSLANPTPPRLHLSLSNENEFPRETHLVHPPAAGGNSQNI
ncbi:hypothetical protein M407DRAFT_166924 [Tulasnella calospora MUT 4182]|uniref:Uncharacterized protein n=1 Tax=Tulasnella calospora MUT 4182 TaxID=1051891 RepID=A0A0C3QNC7_9AGAM|nr:hypothetical protein M407DRAFT_166924 [Tulasnella calospora MUT 4182]